MDGYPQYQFGTLMDHNCLKNVTCYAHGSRVNLTTCLPDPSYYKKNPLPPPQGIYTNKHKE